MKSVQPRRKPAPSTKFTAKLGKLIKSERKKGFAAKVIAANHGISTTTLYSWVHQHGLWDVAARQRAA